MTSPQPTTVNWFPSLKVYGGGAAGIVAALIVWALHQYAHLDLPDPLPEALPTLVGFGLAYFLPHTTGTPGQIQPPAVPPAAS